jgi:hypothetical protein
MYYLETNAIRILSNKLKGQYYVDKCYTSVLSVCELLSGIKDEDTFNLRKGIISKVYLSKIPADLDMPETKMFKAYDIHIDNTISDKIILLGFLCVTSKFYTEFLTIIKQSNLIDYWEFLKKYDKSADIKFKESLKNRQKDFDYSDPNLIPDFNQKWNNLSINNELKERILYDLIVYFAEEKLKPDSIIKVIDKSLKDLIREYDHSLDLYFLCIGAFTGEKIIFRNTPSRNDYFDLSHLMFLRNKSDIIVSNDSMLTKLMRKISPDNILSISDLESIIEK